jgi:transposase InsO family protein
MQRISLDILTLNTDRRQDVLVILDEYTRYCVTVMIPNQEAHTIAEKFLEHFVLKHWIPDEMITDRGANFLSELFQTLCAKLRIHKINTTAYHPQSNGSNERVHSTLYGILRVISETKGRDWRKNLGLATFIYNTSHHRVLGMSPFQALYGYAPKHLSYDYYVREEEEIIRAPNDRILDLMHLRNWLHKRMNEAQEARNEYNNQGRQMRTYRGGEIVKIVKFARNHKLDEHHRGPATIIRQISPSNYLVELPGSNIHPVIHVSALRPWF